MLRETDLNPRGSAQGGRWMNSILKLIYVLSLGVWTGVIVFFSFVVVRVARQIEPKQTSKFLRGIFPEYYFTQIICSALAFLGALGLVATKQFACSPCGVMACALLAAA